VIYSRNCYRANNVNGYNRDTGLMSYANYSIHMDAYAGNDADVGHGLNGGDVYEEPGPCDSQRT